MILFMDGHASHINLQVIRLARECRVILLCLPSHTTHALQPLDVGVYGPLKGRWGKILKEYKMETCAAVVDKTEFPGLLEKLWEESFEAKHLKAGFHKAGLCPLSTENISQSSFAPSLPHALAQSKSQAPTQGTDTGNATGTATSTATGTAISNATGTATGTATGAATGAATGTAMGNATGTATGTAMGTATSYATGTAMSNATGTATGVATDTHLVHVKVSCCECYNEKQLTPVQVYL